VLTDWSAHAGTCHDLRTETMLIRAAFPRQLSSHRAAGARGAVNRLARGRVALAEEVDRDREPQVVGGVHGVTQPISAIAAHTAA
jgi:hypothetical protein